MKHNFTLLSVMLLAVAGACAADPVPDFYQVRGGIPNSQFFFKENSVGNQYLFFIGNSVLGGTGLKDANLRYSARMVQGFKKHFPEASIIETRNTQPGGSWFGLYRCSRGQAVVGEVLYSGHLAILDFAADDRNVDLDHAKLSLEGLLRQITLYRGTHSRILVYTLTPEMLKAYKAGQTPDYIRVSEQIAEHYGVPSLNLAKYAAQKIIAGEISFDAFSADGINPTDAGAKIYAEAVAKFVDALLTANPVPAKAQPVKLPAPLFPETDDNGCIVAYEEQQVQQAGNWKPGQASPIAPFRHLLVSAEPGAALTLKFKYYKEVQDYVLKHNSDLLVIGGISNGGDAEAVRSVVQQVRAKRSETEVLLLTPVFGSTNDEHIRTFTREIDTTKSNFRFNMQKVAAEEKCAFFDMTSPWWTYIQDSGKTYGWFMGDSVHANHRGSQIIGRLLEIWFKAHVHSDVVGQHHESNLQHVFNK